MNLFSLFRIFLLKRTTASIKKLTAMREQIRTGVSLGARKVLPRKLVPQNIFEIIELWGVSRITPAKNLSFDIINLKESRKTDPLDDWPSCNRT